MHNGCAIRFCGLKWETLSSGHTSTGNFSSQHSKSPSNHDTQWESVTSSPLKWMATGFHKCVVCFPNAIPLSLKDLSASSGMTICWWNIIPVISLYITVKSPHFSIGPSFDKSLVPDLPSSMDQSAAFPAAEAHFRRLRCRSQHISTAPPSSWWRDPHQRGLYGGSNRPRWGCNGGV